MGLLPSWDDIKTFWRTEEPDSGDWMTTPWWQIRRWLGYPMRRWCYDEFSMGGYHDGRWRYATFEEAARSILKEEFDDETEREEKKW